MKRFTSICGLMLVLLALAATAFSQSEEQAIAKWLAGYDAALNVRDLDRLATFYHADATIVEGTGRETGGPITAISISAPS